MSNDNAQNDPDNRPAVGAQVQRGVRPRAWWVAPEDSPSDGAVWTCEPTAEDLAWMMAQTGRAAIVTELGDLAAERERCAKIAEAEDVAPTDDPLGVQQCIADSIRRA
jgi:hypothetical protein